MNKLIFLSTIFLVNLFALEMESSLEVKNENALLTNKAILQKAVLDATLELDFTFEDDSKIVNINRLRLDAKDKIEPGKFVNSNYSNLAKPVAIGDTGQIELRELYYEKPINNTTLKLGKMQTVWGKADGIKLLDKLNPQDFSEFILEDFENSRIPLWSISVTQSFESSLLEFLWVPDTTYHKLPKQGAAYQFSSPRVIPKAVTGINVVFVDAEKPKNIVKDADIGVRYMHSFKNLELGFYYIYAYENFPTLYQDFNSSTLTVTINPTYERSSLYGLSADYSNGNYVYRIEAALTNGKYFLNSHANRGVKQSDEFSYIFGIDWYGLNESLVSVQLNQSYLLEFIGGFTRPEIDSTITFFYKKDLMNNTLHFELLEIHNFDKTNGVLRPKLKYELDEETLIYTGIDIFYGNKSGLYGEFRNQNRVLVGIEKTF